MREHVAQAGSWETRNVGSQNMNGRYLRDLHINQRTIVKWTGKNGEGVKVQARSNWVGTRLAAVSREHRNEHSDCERGEEFPADVDDYQLPNNASVPWDSLYARVERDSFHIRFCNTFKTSIRLQKSVSGITIDTNVLLVYAIKFSSSEANNWYLPTSEPLNSLARPFAHW